MQVRDKIKICKDGKCIEAIALFDTGADVSVVSESLAKKLGFNRYEEPISIGSAYRGKEGQEVGDLVAELEIGGCRMNRRSILYVVHDLAEDVIIGMNIIEHFKVKLDLGRGKAYFETCPPVVKIV